MNEPTARDVARALFLPSTDPRQGFDHLVAVVMDLMMEVEALRRAIASASGYPEAYRSTALLTHDASGPSTGWDKLLHRFYPEDQDARGRAWRESLMLRRLGCSSEDLEAYQREAEGMEVLT